MIAGYVNERNPGLWVPQPIQIFNLEYDFRPEIFYHRRYSDGPGIKTVKDKERVQRFCLMLWIDLIAIVIYRVMYGMGDADALSIAALVFSGMEPVIIMTGCLFLCSNDEGIRLKYYMEVMSNDICSCGN